MTSSPPPALQIVQIAPQIASGSGVAGVAYELERALLAAGIDVVRFTRTEAGARQSSGPRSRIAHAWDVVWFSTIGTRRARAFLAARPEAVSICHNDALAGDIYVNHGLLQAAMRARGHYLWRMVRNPLHLYTAARDRARYRGRFHRIVVALTSREASLLTEIYGSVPAPIEVIPNGVDVDRFRIPTGLERRAARSALGLGADEWVATFIGHEFDRKGLPLAIDALVSTPDVRLLVVGGTAQMIAAARADAERLGVADRVVFAGTVPDPLPALWASDAVVLPSAYEANALVVLEALACGVPVISTAVGAAPDLVRDGVNGFLIDRRSDQVAQSLLALRALAPGEMRAACRAAAEGLSWSRIAARYIETARLLQATPPRTVETS